MSPVLLLCLLLAACLGAGLASASDDSLAQRHAAKAEPGLLVELETADLSELIVLLDAPATSGAESRVVTATSLTPTPTAAGQRDAKLSHERTLRVKDPTSLSATKTKFLRRLPATTRQLRDYPQLPMLLVEVQGRTAAEALLADPAVLRVYANEAHWPLLADSLPLIGQPAAFASGNDGFGATVAILDTGLDYQRAEFGSCTKPGQPDGCRVLAAEEIASPGDNRRDDHGHGTQVAAIIAAVAPGARLVALDVIRNGSAATADLLTAVDWVLEHRAQYGIVAVNLSLGGKLFASECGAESWATVPFATLRAVGVLPIAGSGNDREAAAIATPACTPGALRVGAVYDRDSGIRTWNGCRDAEALAGTVACFSNSASFLHLLAPGVGILAVGALRNGTSMATAHVSGAAAVLRGLSAFPDDTPAQTEARLLGSGPLVLDGRNGFSFPLLDLGAAVQAVQPAPAGWKINPGLNDAWLNPARPGQGLLLAVLPDKGQLFVAWFSFDTQRPADTATALLGEPGHRWLTALGPYSGNRAELVMELSSGGRFDDATFPVEQEKVGTLTLEFSDCANGFVKFNLPASGQSGGFAIRRAAPDNQALCEALALPD